MVLTDSYGRKILPGLLEKNSPIYLQECCNKIIESVHLKFCKYILGLKSSVNNNFIYGELGRYPVDIVIRKNMITYWQSVVTGRRISYVMLRINVCSTSIVIILSNLMYLKAFTKR